jgi:hypothetical protein
LSQRLTKLAEFDEASRRVFLEVTLGKRTEANELRVVHSQEREVRRC